MKKIVTLALTALMLLSCVTSFASFNDVTSDDWAYAEISAMESLGFIKGDANGNFNPSKALTLSDLKALPNWEGIIARPAAAEAIGENADDKEMTRAEFVSVIIKAINATSDHKGSSFSDVADDAWFSSDVECAKAIGLINGYEDGTFRADNKVSKREAAVVGFRLKNFIDMVSK